ncbi:MAG TPA: SIMPL domain-containing protein [Fimbriimonadales bacterium]|nr:SIMPL domain-containing protein [Fimbriimonadales bacterium]
MKTYILLLITFLFVSGCQTPQNPVAATFQNEEGIRVFGTAIVRAEPDIATVNLGYVGTSATASAAHAQGNTVMRKVLDAIRAKGIEDDDIRTVEYSLHRTQQTPSGRVVWTIRNVAEIRVHDLDKLPDVIDTAVSAGANYVGNVQYTVEKLEDLRSKARKEAIEVAKRKAEEMASLLGVKVGKPKHISEAAPYYDYGLAAQRVIETPEAVTSGTELSAGRATVQLRVDVLFEIE